MAAHYLAVMDAVCTAGLNAQVAVTPTHLGLDIDGALRLAERPANLSFVLRNLVTR